MVGKTLDEISDAMRENRTQVEALKARDISHPKGGVDYAKIETIERELNRLEKVFLNLKDEMKASQTEYIDAMQNYNAHWKSGRLFTNERVLHGGYRPAPDGKDYGIGERAPRQYLRKALRAWTSFARRIGLL